MVVHRSNFRILLITFVFLLSIAVLASASEAPTIIDSSADKVCNGETMEMSQYLITLQPSEQMVLLIYHNYSQSGTYNVLFSSESDIYRESEKRTVTI